MRRTFLSVIVAAAMLMGTGVLSAQFLAGQGSRQGKMYGKGNRSGPGDCTGQGQRQGRGAKSGKRTGPQDGSGPIHDPQGGGRGRRGR